MRRWYVTCSEYADRDDPEARVWTLSRDPNKEGWCTDGGYPEYGLTFEEATELAEAANAAHR